MLDLRNFTALGCVKIVLLTSFLLPAALYRRLWAAVAGRAWSSQRSMKYSQTYKYTTNERKQVCALESTELLNKQADALSLKQTMWTLRGDGWENGNSDLKINPCSFVQIYNRWNRFPKANPQAPEVSNFMKKFDMKAQNKIFLKISKIHGMKWDRVRQDETTWDVIILYASPAGKFNIQVETLKN